jgi:hypothetical protein
MKKIIVILFVFMLGCSAKQMREYQKEECTKRGLKFQIILDENYKAVGVKCLEK